VGIYQADLRVPIRCVLVYGSGVKDKTVEVGAAFPLLPSREYGPRSLEWLVRSPRVTRY